MSAQPERIEAPEKVAARRFADEVIRKGYKAEALHLWQRANGSPWCWRIRCKHPATGEKWIRPMHRTASGFELGEPPAPPEGKPLYHLPELLKVPAPSDAVLIVEGEKCADALAKLGMVATTSGSADSAEAVDWTPLRGRRALVWPDFDTAGMRYAEAVCAKLRALGCAVDVIDVGALGLEPKGDCVDWLALHPNATAADVLALPKLSKPAPAVSVEDRAEPRALPDPLPKVAPFNRDLLPASIRAWCEDAAEGLDVPLDFLAVPAVVALGGAIGRAVGVRPKVHERWIEPAILWGAVIGRPSTGKSPALAPARRMLERLERQEAERYREALASFEADALVAAALAETARTKVKDAVRSGDFDAARQAAMTAAASPSEAPPETRLVVTDATVEKLGAILQGNPRGLLMFRDELIGWLAAMDREGREGDRAFWLECWTGSPYTVDRIGRGTLRIEACAVSVLGGIQPGKLAAYVRGAVRGGMGDDGLVQRFGLAVYPDLPPTWRYSDRPANPDAERQARLTFERLRAITPQGIGATVDEDGALPWLPLAEDAREVWIDWQQELMTRLRAGQEPPHLESHFSKYRSIAVRLALVLHLADTAGGPVSGEAMARALDWCGYLESHARRIYAPLADGGIGAAHLLLKRRSDLPDPFTARDVYNRDWSGLDREAVERAIEALIEYGHLAELPPEQGNGRPTARYRWGASA